MLIVYLKETFINEFADAAEEEQTEAEEENSEVSISAIQGLDNVYPFDTIVYTIEGYENGTWSLSNTKAKINRQTSKEVSITITSAKSGSIDLIYKLENGDTIVKTITIKSL